MRVFDVSKTEVIDAPAVGRRDSGVACANGHDTTPGRGIIYAVLLYGVILLYFILLQED